jgi:hypothetical protein
LDTTKTFVEAIHVLILQLGGDIGKHKGKWSVPQAAEAKLQVTRCKKMYNALKDHPAKTLGSSEHVQIFAKIHMCRVVIWTWLQRIGVFREEAQVFDERKGTETSSLETLGGQFRTIYLLFVDTSDCVGIQTATQIYRNSCNNHFEAITPILEVERTILGEAEFSFRSLETPIPSELFRASRWLCQEDGMIDASALALLKAETVEKNQHAEALAQAEQEERETQEAIALVDESVRIGLEVRAEWSQLKGESPTDMTIPVLANDDAMEVGTTVVTQISDLPTQGCEVGANEGLAEDSMEAPMEQATTTGSDDNSGLAMDTECEAVKITE